MFSSKMCDTEHRYFLREMGKPYLIFTRPNGIMNLGVSKSVVLEEPEEYIAPPSAGIEDDMDMANWGIDMSYRAAELAMYKKSKLLRMMLTIDMFCSVLLIAMAIYYAYNEFIGIDDLSLFLVYGIVDIFNNLLLYVLGFRLRISGMFILFMIGCLVLTGLSVFIFSPLVLFHLLIFIIAAQTRAIMVRLDAQQPPEVV